MFDQVKMFFRHIIWVTINFFPRKFSIVYPKPNLYFVRPIFYETDIFHHIDFHLPGWL
jgi:hypothetical protein